MNSPSSSAGPALPSGLKIPRPLRRGVRNATYIIPSTRERVKRQITLHSPTNFDGPAGINSASSDDSFLPFERRLSSAGRLKTALHNTRVCTRKAWRWLNTDTGRNVLKCSLAYLLASMATFITPISNFLGYQDGKHLVATMCVYFHPGRSAGSMLEAVMLGFIAVLYATFISISSMAVSVLCETQLRLIELGYIIVLVVFCGGGLGFVGWVKQKLNQPLVNVACSLTSLAIIIVLTKENAVQTAVFSNTKIVQVLKMLVIAIFVTTTVNLLLWPVYARYALRQTMIKSTDAFGDMLATITQSFLDGSESDLRSSDFLDATRRYKSVFGQLSKHLKEAKAEHYVLGTANEYIYEARLVNCMQKLAQATGGLRSAAMTQFTLLKETSVNGNSTPTSSIRYSKSHIRSGPIQSALPAIDEAPDENSEVEDAESRLDRQTSDLTSSGITIRTPSDIFNQFIQHLGPSMKSLAYTLCQILRDLPFSDGPGFKIATHEHFKASLTDALKLYSTARAQALDELYKSKDLGGEKLADVEADFEEVAASCGHFSFNLQDFAEEMQIYLEILDELKDEIEKPNRRSWNWLKFWQVQRRSRNQGHSDPERDALLDQNEETGLPKDMPELSINQKYSVSKSENQLSTRTFFTGILNVIKFLQRDDVRFAVKVGIGAALWAMFAFIPATRPIYSHWRGEWGLLSFMLVCSMTIGASNTTGYSRFIGTLIGAILSVVAWLACQANPFALAFCGWLVSIPCFYLIVGAGKAPLGRFILLTYNISALYAYSLSVRQGEDDEDEGGVNPIITEIALHRLIAVLSGVLWGLIITRVIWPISARQKLKDGLSIIWLRMGLIWKRDPLSAILAGSSSNAYMDLREEFALQRYISRLEILRAAAASEFELRGPFPQAEYGRIMDSTNKMLDAFHAMNVVIQKDLKASEGEAAILKYTVDERTQLSARISHLFQVVASSMKLEYPINDALPSISTSRDRLLAKTFHFRKNDANADAGPVAKDEDYALLYAYALVTGQLADEIMKVEKEIEGLFGVLDEDVFQMY